MDKRTSFLSITLALITFILLEGLGVFLISRNSIIQRYRIMEGIRSVQSFFWKQGEQTRYYFSLKKANEKLTEENKKLLSEVDRLKEMVPDDSSYLADFGDKASFRYITAKIVRNSTNRKHNFIVIDKGARDGIKEDMGVITPSGLIGYVQSVGEKYSQVISFLDIDQSVSAIIKSNNTFGPLKWDGVNIDKAILHEIPLHTTITVGDTVVSSGFSSIYPPSIPLGTIESSQLVDGINYNVTIDLFEDFSSLHYVYVVVSLNNNEFFTFEGKKGGKG